MRHIINLSHIPPLPENLHRDCLLPSEPRSRLLLDITIFRILCCLLVTILSAASSVNYKINLPSADSILCLDSTFLACQSIMSLQLFVENKISQVSLDLNYILIQLHKKAVHKAKQKFLFKMEFKVGMLRETLIL